MATSNNLQVKLYRNKYAVFAGKSRLGQMFKTEEQAIKDLEKNKELYIYWAGCAGVSIENTEAVVKYV